MLHMIDTSHGRADCAGSLRCQLMKSERAIWRAYSPRISATKQQKTPTGAASDAGRIRPSLGPLYAARDRFFLPPAATRLAPPHTRRACARRICSVAAGMRASRRAPPGFSRAHAAPERGGPRHGMPCRGYGSVALQLGLDARPGKPGGARRSAVLAGGALPPTTAPRLGPLETLGRFLPSGSPRAFAPTLGRGCCGGLWRACAFVPSLPSVGSSRAFLRGLTNGWRDGSPSLALRSCAPSACTSPLQCGEGGTHPSFRFVASSEV